MNQDKKLENILNFILKEDTIKNPAKHQRLILHLYYHPKVSEQFVEYALKKLENGSKGNDRIYNTCYEIFKKFPLFDEKYLFRIKMANSNRPSIWPQ